MSSNKIVFSKKSLDALEHPQDGQRVNYYDTKVSGLQLCVSSTGVKTFSVHKWVDGKARRVVLGRYDGLALQSPEFEGNPLTVLGNNPRLTAEQARQLALAVLTQLATGQTSQEVRKKKIDQITLGQLFTEYLDKYAIDHTKTWKVMEECFYRYLSEWKNTPVGTIKKGDVQLLINKLGKERGKTTANRTLELLRAIINKGKEWSLVTGDNPAAGIAKYKLKPRERFIHLEELPRLAAAIEAEPKEEIRDYVMLSLYTGARKSNVLSMKWQDVDLATATWTIPDTKNDSSQTILLTEVELKILRRRQQKRKRQEDPGYPFVFPGAGVSGHLEDPKKGWQRILKRAQIDNLNLHDLRRSLGSYMAMSGASLSVIGNALNHKDVSTTRRVYAHSAHEAERKAREVAHQMMFPKNESTVEASNISKEDS